MSVLGIGIDIVEVDRILDSLNQYKTQFLNRVFTSEEQKYCEAQKNRELSYAARFAAKEAVSKSFGTGIGRSLGWKDIEVINADSGEPTIKLHNKAEELAKSRNVSEVKVSLTHTQHYAAANAVIIGHQ